MTSPINNSVIVSLTSFPARIKTVSKTIKTLLNQSIKPDKIILYLSKAEFPNAEKNLPNDLLILRDHVFEIHWIRENLKSFKKLIPTLSEYPESVIITADDDILYKKDWLKKLIQSYRKFPHDIHCHRAHLITFHQGKINPYLKWNFCIPFQHKLIHNIFPTTGAGTLYPPHSLHFDVFKKNLFMKLSPSSDDIWFWAMAVRNNTKIRVVKQPLSDIKCIPETQGDNCLWRQNVFGKAKNDKQIKKVLDHFPDILEKLDHGITSTEISTIKYYLFGFIPLFDIHIQKSPA